MPEDSPTTPSQPASSAPPRRPVLEVLGKRDYRLLWTAGWGWHASRWIWTIVAGYLVLELTGSTFQTQLVGVAWSGPMLVMGIFSGLVADSFDRRSILLTTHFMNVAIVGTGLVLVLTGYIQGWHILVLTAGIGLSNTLDMATRRAFVSDIADRNSLPFALALESMSMTGAAMVGPWIGGALVDLVPIGTFGAGAPFILTLVMYIAAITQLMRISKVTDRVRAPFRLGSALANTAEGLRVVAKNRAVVGTLGITVLFNLFFFSYTPLIPVFAREVLDVSPTLMGVLAGAQGGGALIGSAFIASRKSIRRNSDFYVYGSMLAMVSLLVFSLSGYFPLSVASLMVAGIGMAGFGTMQATIILLAVSDEVRGRAMGVVNMAIGALPLGMLAVGGLAELLGPGRAVTLSSALGIAMVGLWAWQAKEMRRL